MKHASDSGTSVTETFKVAQPTSVQKDLDGWVRFLIEKNLPLSCVEDKGYRNQSRFRTKFTAKRCSTTIHKIVKEVKGKIAKEMREAGRGSILYDAWTECSLHFVAIFACYIRKIKGMKDGVPITTEKSEIKLLSVAPMMDVMNNDAKDEDERKIACEFNAELYTEHFVKIFTEFYKLDVRKWAKACIADNCATNLKIARLLGLPHVPCGNHLLNLDIREWVKNDAVLNNTVKKIARTMRQAKSQKNSAALSHETTLKPVMNNDTRWSGIRCMLERFVRIREDLIRTAEKDGTDLEVEDGANFARICRKYLVYMEELDSTTKLLQTRLQPLYEARALLDDIIEETESSNQQRIRSNSAFRNCTFVPKRIKLNHTRLHTNANFESGVCKIQEKKELTLDEAAACENLLLANMVVDNDDNDASDEDNNATEAEEDDAWQSMAQRHAKRMREKEAQKAAEQNLNDTAYGNCNFILGSVAEVERLWSVCKHILTNERKGRMECNTFEGLILLKMNIEHWNIHDVVLADVAQDVVDDEEEMIVDIED